MDDERVNYRSVQWGMFWQWALFSSCYFLFLCLCLSLLFLLLLLWPLVPDAAVPSYGPYGRYSMFCVFVSVGF